MGVGTGVVSTREGIQGRGKCESRCLWCLSCNGDVKSVPLLLSTLQFPSRHHERSERSEKPAEELDFEFDNDFESLGGKKYNFSESPW